MAANMIVGYVAIGVAAAGAGFFGGMQYRNYQLAQNRGAFFTQASGRNGAFLQGNGAGRMMQNGGGRVAGQIVKVDPSSITVQLPNGGTRLVLTSDQTAFMTATTTTKEALKVGERISAFGTANSDGSVSAQNVQLEPAQ